jgi:hypothetical protein
MKCVSLIFVVLCLSCPADARYFNMLPGRDTFVFDYPDFKGRTIQVYEIGTNEPPSDEQESLMHNWFAVEDIFEAIPQSQIPFFLGSSPGINNAFAAIYRECPTCQRKRYIVVDPLFHSDYELLAMVMAHEIVHHVCGHQDGILTDNPYDRELEADQFAGAAIRGLEGTGGGWGITIQSALNWGSKIFSVVGTDHPPQADRLAAMVKGYSSGSPCIGRKIAAIVPNEPGAGAGVISGTGIPLWNHNGSTMRLVAVGSTRKFFYENPREGLASVGVTTGKLLFTGRKSGNSYSGTAYIFSHCGQAPYRVSGPVSGDQRQVTLYGRAPVVAADCRISSYQDDALVFTFLGD